ncbi:MAG: hypothetical protein GY861_05935 [bacterium]|nr:hypothetical protein [bacterium]
MGVNASGLSGGALDTPGQPMSVTASYQIPFDPKVQFFYPIPVDFLFMQSNQFI